MPEINHVIAVIQMPTGKISKDMIEKIEVSPLAKNLKAGKSQAARGNANIMMMLLNIRIMRVKIIPITTVLTRTIDCNMNQIHTGKVILSEISMESIILTGIPAHKDEIDTIEMNIIGLNIKES